MKLLKKLESQALASEPQLIGASHGFDYWSGRMSRLWVGVYADGSQPVFLPPSP